MKLFILLFLVSTAAWSRVTLELRLGQNSVKQGQIVHGQLLVTATDGNAALSGLKDKNFGKTLYIQKLAPFMMKQDQVSSDVSVIFAQVPQGNSVTELINGDEVVISWNDIRVSPVEAKSFLFGDFEIPERIHFLPWILGILGLTTLIGLYFAVKKKLYKKSLHRSEKEKLKKEILGCTSYEEIVLMWRQKRRYLDAFPSIEKDFKTFEEVLFKYQFKPQRTQQELAEVTSAYHVFKASAAGVLHGV